MEHIDKVRTYIFQSIKNDLWYFYVSYGPNSNRSIVYTNHYNLQKATIRIYKKSISLRVVLKSGHNEWIDYGFRIYGISKFRMRMIRFKLFIKSESQDSANEKIEMEKKRSKLNSDSRDFIESHKEIFRDKQLDKLI